MVRIAEQNGWVFLCIVGCLAVFTFMLIFLHRSGSIRDFLLESCGETGNNYLSWILCSSVFAVMVSVMISQFIPVVPEPVSKISLFGFGLNKFGVVLVSILLFFVMRSLLSFLFYAGAGNARRWNEFTFLSAKFYFLASFAVMAVCLAVFYYPVERIFAVYLGIGMAFVLIISKILLYIFNSQPVLPSRWYHKFLYICTLQIAPLFALWKFLFL